MYYKDEINNYSKESIFSQKIAKLTKSESLFNIYSKFSPSLTSSELKLRETRLKNFKEKAEKWEINHDKSRFPQMIQTRSLVKNELEILKINMSIHDKIVAIRQSQIFRDCNENAKKKKRKRVRKSGKRSAYLLCSCLNSKVEDLVTQIEDSESAKTDKVIWKFLKRQTSFRNDFINSRKLLLETEALKIPGFEFRKDSRFQNTKPIKITCPNCMFYITTHVKKITSIRTKLVSIIFAIVGFCVVPHIFYAFRDSVHLCPLCKIYLGFCPSFNIKTKRRRTKFSEYDQKKCQLLNGTLPTLEESLVICGQCEHYPAGVNLNSSEHSYSKPITPPSNRGLKYLKRMVSASSTSAKNLFVESKLRLSDRVQVNVNNIAAITRQIQRGSKANENLMNAAKNFAFQEAAIENSETNLKKLKLLTTHISNQLDSLHGNSSKMEMVLEQVRSMQR